MVQSHLRHTQAQISGSIQGSKVQNSSLRNTIYYDVLLSSHSSLIGVNEEDLDDDLKLPPARLCDLIWRLSHH